jgi:pimeloyl-ACP methyl ester carboxylesterase
LHTRSRQGNRCGTEPVRGARYSTPGDCELVSSELAGYAIERRRMFDQGNGPPLVVVQGVQGRWEWTRPALERLSARCRTISYSLCGDIGSKRRFEAALGFDNYVQQLDEILDRAGVGRVAICGLSFGGFVAVHYAAMHPERVSALILASAPGPGFQPNAQQARWLARPWLSTPAFVINAPVRVWPELTASFPAVSRRIGFLMRQGMRCAASPMAPPLMASRLRVAAMVDFETDCQRISRPTLVLAGEDGLDRVVPVESTRRYASLIRGAEFTTFADIVSEFVHAHHH